MNAQAVPPPQGGQQAGEQMQPDPDAIKMFDIIHIYCSFIHLFIIFNACLHSSQQHERTGCASSTARAAGGRADAARSRRHQDVRRPDPQIHERGRAAQDVRGVWARLPTQRALRQGHRTEQR